jgi:hypothetical protein
MKDIKTYNVGDKVWWAKCGTEEVKNLCPVCYGKLEVILTLGNNEEVVIPCDYCGHGIDKPKGYVIEYEYIAEPTQVSITSVRSETGCQGEKREYNYGYYHLDNKDIFDTLEEASERCAEIVAQKTEDELKARHVKKVQYKSYSWNAGYHLRQIRDAERSISYHNQMVKICHERAREQKNRG